MTEYRLANGQKLTEDMIDEVVAEAEAGYDVEDLKAKRGRGRPALGEGPSTVLPVRLDPELATALQSRVAETGTQRSDLVRDALRRYLAA